jgi:hypothetical protein
MLFNFALEYVIWKAQENQMGLKFDTSTSDAVNVYVLGGNINIIKINMEALIRAGKELVWK